MLQLVRVWNIELCHPQENLKGRWRKVNKPRIVNSVHSAGAIYRPQKYKAQKQILT